MKTVTTTKAWILICSIIVVSSATTDHASAHHDVPDHGDSIPQNRHHNTIVPFGIEIPEHILPKQDVACISADSNIFEIMNKAQETCNGTDMRCTFYHFVNHGYHNIGTLDINKELFDDLLMKFDNWLLTDENIEKDEVTLAAKAKKDSSLDAARIHVNGSHQNEEPIENSIDVSETERLFTNQGVHIYKVDHNTNKSDDDKVINTHHTYDTHHRNHHHKWKNGNHIKLIPEYNNEHRYFEVFLPKDKVTGKPRTIYVEIDREKNEFILLDEEIDRKLNGTKPIRIELDELSEIADSAFSNIAKSSIHKEHINTNLYDHEISDLNTNSELHEDETHVDIDVGKCTAKILNSSVCYPNICNINANQQLISANTTGLTKKITNVSKNLVVPNKYINHAQFYLESQIDNTTDDIPNDHWELLESSNNEIDIHQTGFNEETLLDTIEFNENKTNIDLDLETIECSPENFDITCDENSTENYELSIEHDNITSYDDYFVHLEENNDTSIDIDFDDNHDFSSSEIIHLNEPASQNEKHFQKNELKSTPNIYTESKLTSILTAGISDYSSPQLDAITSENRQGDSNLQAHSPEPDVLLYTTVPLLGKHLAKVSEADGHLQSSFPVYATSDLPVSASQNTLLDADIEHPSISSYDSPLDSDFANASPRPKTFQSTFPICPSPPVECVVRLNKGSKYSPLNFGFSWLPSYSRIEELRLPSALGPLSQESILPVLKNKQRIDSTSPELSSDVSVEDPTLYSSLNVNIQEPSLTIEPYHLEANAPVPLKNVLLSKLNSPKSSTYLDSIPTPYQLSESPLSVMPNLKSTVNSPCPVQRISPYFQPTNNQDFGFIKYSPFDNNSKETMSPCAINLNRYPYTTIPYLPNPYFRPPQFIPAYLEPLMALAPLQPSYKIPTLDSLPLSSDQSKPCPIEDYSKITKPNPLVPFAVNTPFSPLNPLPSEPSFVPNTLPCPNLWNNIASLPYTVIPDQNIRNYSPIVSNYLNPSAGSQQNQFFKTFLSKSVPLSAIEQPCPIENISEITPSSYTPFFSIYNPPEQKALNPSLALERDLQSLSMKYGIPLSKILNSFETEICDTQGKTSSPTLEVPYSNLAHDRSLISKPVLTKTNAVLDDQNRSGYEESLSELDVADLVPLDSSLIGPNLEIERPLMLETNGSQSHTVVSETIIPTLHSRFENQTTMVIHDSSLIGPHLSTSSTSNIVLSDENRNAKDFVISELDSSNSILLDSSLIGPHLETGSTPIVLDSNNSHSNIPTSHTDVPITISSEIEPILQHQSTNIILDSSLIGSHLPSLSPVKPLLSDGIQTIKDNIPMETDLTELTPLDSADIHTQGDLVNQLSQTKNLQHENTAVILSAANASPELNKSGEYLHTNLVEEELLLESDSSRLIPLDSSLIGPELKLGSASITTDSPEDITMPLVSKESLESTDNKIEELKAIILPSSLLPTLLNNPVKADSNLNIITQETKLNKELEELSLDTNVELPLTDISHVSFKETDFKIVEPIPELTAVIEDGTLKEESKLVESELLLDSSLTGGSILYNLKNPGNSTSFDSSINFDSSIIASQEISPILGSESSLAHTTISQNKKPLEFFTVIDSSTELESSVKGPTLHNEINSKETSTAFESVTHFDNSLVPSLHETKESAATTSVLNSSYLDSSLIGPSLHQKTIEVSRAFDSKNLLDSSLVGPRLLTPVSFSSDEIQMINEELQSKSDLVNLTPLDSSLIGPHVDFETKLEQSEISRYHNPELSKTSANNGVYETTGFVPSYLDKGKSNLELSDYHELVSKFKNAITKSQLSPTELKPCDKLLSSIAEMSSENYALPSCKDLQTLTLNTLLNTPLSLQGESASEFSPIIITSPAQGFSPQESIAKGLDSNYFQIPQMLAESLPYAQAIPHIPTMSYSPFVQTKPLIDRNWLGQNNIQNILQISPSFRPVVGNAPVPLISNASPFTPEDLKSLLGLASHGKLYPQLSLPDMYTPGNAITSPLKWITPSNILPVNQYNPLLSKNISTVFPSNSESEYSPILVADIMSHLDKNSLQLLKDMSIVPFSQSSLPHIIPVFEKGKIDSPSLLETVPILDSDYINTRPLLSIPITNPLISSSVYNPQLQLYNPQNVLSMIQMPNISPCNLKPYSNLPLHSEFSEIVGPASKVVSIPTEFPNAVLQQLMSKPCVESPKILPSLLLDTMLQLPTASNELNSVPCQLPPEYFTPIAPICTTPLSNAFPSPISPIYASPLSVSYAQPIPTPSTSLALNVPYIDSVVTSTPLPINPYTARPFTPKYSNPVMPIKLTPMSNYPYQPTVAYNIPIPSEIPYKPSQTYSSPYLPVHPSLIPIDTSPGSPNIMSKRLPAMPSPVSPVLSEPLPTAYFSPLSKSSTSLGLPTYSAPLEPTFTSLLPPSYYSHTSSYSSVPGPINTQIGPSNLLKPAYITPISPLSTSLSSHYTPTTFNPISSPNPKIKPELQTLRSLNTLPISSTVNPFLNTNQRLPINPNILPIQKYATRVPMSNYNSKIKQNIPYEGAIESNLLTSPLTEKIPSYDVTEESAYTYSNDKDDKFYEEPTSKYPLESLSCTLAPEEVAETLSNEDFVKIIALTPPAPANNRAPELSMQAKLYQPLRLKPYTPLHGKPVLKPRPAAQLLQPLSLIETISENIHENIPLVPTSSPLKHPVSLPTSILSSPLMKPLSPLTFAPIDISRPPYSQLPLNEKLQLLSFSPHYSTPSQDRSPIYPTGLRNIVNSQVTPASSQVPANAPFVIVSSPIGLPKLQTTASPSLLDNYIELPLTHNEPISKTLTSPSSLVKPLSKPNYNQYAAPIISHISPIEMPITSQYISSPISVPHSLKKTKPSMSPQYISSILPTQTTLQDSSPLNKAPIYYQPFNELPTALTSSAYDIFRNPPVISPYAVLPSINMVEPVSVDLTRPQWSSFTPQYSLPASSLPVPLPSPIISHSNIPYSRISSHIPKQALTNHIIPSSLFMSSDSDFQTPKNKLSPLSNIPRYSLPSPFLTEPLETVPFYTPSRSLDTLANPQNILKPKSPLSNVKYPDPMPSSPYFTQPLQPADSYQTQPLTNPKTSPPYSHYASPSSAATYTSLTSETAPKRLTNKPSAPQYSPSNTLVYDSKIYSSPKGEEWKGKNPFLNPDFKPIIEVPSYPVPKNIISSSTPSESILLSNLRPLDISPESQSLYSSPITYSTPFSPPSLLKSSAKRLPQNSRQHKPHITSSNSHYVSQSPMNNASQISPPTSPLLKCALLQSLLANSQDNAPLVQMHVSNMETALPESFPIKPVPSITSPNIDLSNYFPFHSSKKYAGPSDSCESFEIETPVNPLSPPYIFLKPPFNKQFKPLVSTLTNMPFNSNYDIIEPTPELSIKTNIINNDKPIELSTISASASSPLSLNSIDTETVEEIEPNEIILDSKDGFPRLKQSVNQHGQFYPSKYLATPQPTKTLPSSKYRSVSSFTIPSSSPEEAELVDTTDFIPLSPIKSEPLITDYSSSDRKAPNTPSIIPEPDVVQLPPYTSILNTEFSPSTQKRLAPKLQTPRFTNQIPQPSPIYISPQEYKDLIQALSPAHAASSSSPVLSSTNIPQPTTNSLTWFSSPQIPPYTSGISIKPENWLQSPIYSKSLALQENFVEATPEKENMHSLLNKYRPVNNITPIGPYKPKSTIPEVFSELDSIKPVNLLLKKEPYIENLKSNEDNDYDRLDEKKPNFFEAKPTINLPKIIKGLSIPNYIKMAQRPQKSSKFDNFYANNHIGKSPQVFNVPTSSIDSTADVTSPYTTITPRNLKDSTDIPTKHFGFVPKLESTPFRPNEYYHEIADPPEITPTTNSYPQNYLNPCLKYSSQMKSLPNTIKIDDSSEITPTSYKSIDDIKYSGYKTYQAPSFKPPQEQHNLGTPYQMYSPSVVTYSSPIPAVKPSNIQPTPSLLYSNLFSPTDISEPIIPQYQTPLQTKLGLDSLQESSELNEYNPIEDIPPNVDSINEDTELKTSLINYINNREDVKTNLYSNNAELTIPLGNIAITRKEPYNANTIETNNPSIGLKVWKSNLKIAQAELKLKFKDLSVNNFMPIVNNLDKYDMEEIRKIVKNYIDEKYGNHLEVNEPYTIDNKYTIIKDFDHNSVDNKYNLLWPTNYV